MIETFGVAIVTYDGLERVKHLYESYRKYNTVNVDRFIIVEDVSPYTSRMDELYKFCKENMIEYVRSEKWGCMQGNGNFAMQVCGTDVVALISDDVLFSGDCLKPHEVFWKNNYSITVGAAQFTHWYAEQLVDRGYLESRKKFYEGNWWTKNIPQSKHWNKDGVSRIYINVHGTGFSLRRSMWEKFGFSQEHWSYDEDISCNIWLNTDEYVTITIPGPCLLHYGGASQCRKDHPELQSDQCKAMEKAWGKTKKELNDLCRKAMDKKRYVNDLLKSATYYDQGKVEEIV